MAIYSNFTRHSVGEVVGLDARGAEIYALVVKATFTWDAAGNTFLAEAPQPVAEQDVFADQLRRMTPPLMRLAPVARESSSLPRRVTLPFSSM